MVYKAYIRILSTMAYSQASGCLVSGGREPPPPVL